MNEPILAVLRKKAEQICIELNQTLSFHLSLSGKEIFHSNFIAYILNKTHIEGSASSYFRNHFISCLYKDSNNPKEFNLNSIKEVRAYREKNNIDLIIKITTIENTEVLFAIELKLKSLPNESQLKKYNEKLNKKLNINGETFFISRKIIISASPPSFNLTEGWSLLSFKEILDFIEPAPKPNLDDYFTNDYLKTTKKLLSALTLSDEALKKFHDNQITLSELNRFLDEFKKARIHDFVSKYAYSKLGKIILDKLLIDDQANFKKIDYEASYSNGSPCVTIKLPSQSPDIDLGLQIQNGELRKFLSHNIKSSKSIEPNESQIMFLKSNGFLGKVKNEHEPLNFGKDFIYMRKNIKSGLFKEIMSYHIYIFNEILRSNI